MAERRLPETPRSGFTLVEVLVALNRRHRLLAALCTAAWAPTIGELRSVCSPAGGGNRLAEHRARGLAARHPARQERQGSDCLARSLPNWRSASMFVFTPAEAHIWRT
jgi:hypothetical protein